MPCGPKSVKLGVSHVSQGSRAVILARGISVQGEVSPGMDRPDNPIRTETVAAEVASDVPAGPQGASLRSEWKAPERRRAAGRRKYDRAKYYAFMMAIAAGIGAILVAMRYLSPALLPLAIIVSLAYLVYPVTQAVHRAIGIPAVTVGLIMIFGAGLLAPAGWKGLPLVANQTRSFMDDLHQVWVDVQMGIPRSIFAAQAARARGFKYESVGVSLAELATKSESGWPEYLAAWNEYLRHRDRPRVEGLARLHAGTAGTYIGRVFEDIVQFVNQRRWNPTINSAIEKVFINGTRALIVIVLGSFLIGFTLVATLYVVVSLSDSLRQQAMWRSLLPEHYRGPIVAWIREFNSAMRQYLVRQAMASALIAALAATGFTYVGLPLAIPLGMLVGLLGMIPYLYLVGLGPAMIIAAFHALESRTPFTPFAVGILATFAVLQLLHLLLFRPYIVGRAPRMERMALLLGAMFWPELMGYPGFFFAIPATCAVIALYRLHTGWRAGVTAAEHPVTADEASLSAAVPA